MRQATTFLAVLLAASGLSGCVGQEEGVEPAVAEPAEPLTATIEGNVTYRERMMLPPGARVEVQLQDVSRADAPAGVLAEVQLAPAGGPPYPFTLEYDTARIQSNMRYALRATISVEDQLMFTTTDYIDPFGSNGTNIIVRRVPTQE